MSKAINIEFIIILITTQCVNLNTVPETKEKKLLISEQSENSSAIVELENKQCNYFGDFFLCSLDHLKQWKKRRRWCYVFKYNKDLFVRSKRSSEPRNPVRRLGLSESSVTDENTLIEDFKRRWPVELWRNYLFTDDYLLLINSHWLHFAPPDPSSNYILGILYIAMMLVGTTGNALVLLMYFRCRTLRTPGNILVANLALSDFCMLAKTPVFIFNSFNLGPALGKTGCVIYGFVGGLTGTTSIATLAAIALDRYWAVVRPLEPLRALTAVRARLFAVGAWLYAGVFASIPALDIGYGRYVPEGYLTSCSFDYLTDELPPRYFIFTFFCAAWVAPFFTITFCYLNILRVVVCNRNVQTKNQEQRLSSRHVKEQVKRKAEIKLAALVIIVIALFFVSWTPYAIVALMGIFGKKDLITPIVSMIPALFCKTAACINPFIYIITHPKFRKEFRKLLFRDKSRRMSTYTKTIGYTEAEASKMRRTSKELSDTDVEVVQMKDIPYDTEESAKPPPSTVKTISSRVSEREGSQRSASMKSFEDSVVSPPSWYAKPKFAKKKSFHRRSSKSVVSMNTEPIVL
ncbi:opsin, ultraviolet-sensitive-like [Cydia pomonella]|uniref:opsin, ultraviolet-sensitive-like n=1 Tax=Cydia pomonella TaxID=82600 RepID=UPI002ADE8B2A|nr:opsin, ultraviolet-sensitive-like [Cydia pomonella]